MHQFDITKVHDSSTAVQYVVVCMQQYYECVPCVVEHLYSGLMRYKQYTVSPRWYTHLATVVSIVAVHAQRKQVFASTCIRRTGVSIY
jgi:hypothetical protein